MLKNGTSFIFLLNVNQRSLRNPHLHFRFGSGQSGPQKDAFGILLKAAYTFCILALSTRLLFYPKLTEPYDNGRPP